jgi:NAD(P)-dependent dehydrogenase (short-subunit alcohol dehydrogenase family)
MAHQNKTLLVIGAGPGIGRSVTTLFASKGYTKVALFARSSEGLAAEQKAVEESVGSGGKVKSYQVDVADLDALAKALAEADADLGKPDCIFYNAARVRPSELLAHDVQEIEYDFKVTTDNT